jgi:transcriptional regulator
MYTPKIYQINDHAFVQDFIRKNGFGILISQAEEKIWATHIPIMLSEDGSKLSGHISKANKQWKGFESGGEVLAIFSGPHTYISSSWYDHQNVPTWNYQAVHVYGTIRIIESDQLYDSLKHLVDKYELASENPVSMETMTPDYVRREMKGVVGFEMTITSVECTNKLSQNRDDKNHERIVNELQKRGDVGSKEIAELMNADRCPVRITKDNDESQILKA